jgi:hypothetical protein
LTTINLQTILYKKVMDEGSTLDWTEVSVAAREIFCIWMSESSKELDWANTAWIALGRAGLTNYTDAVQKTLVLVRFLILGSIFREFCELTREEPSDCDVDDWAEALEINSIRVGQVLGPGALKEPVEDLNLVDAINELMDQNRDEIVSTLVKYFGNESSLFLSLWKASDGAEIEEPEDDDFVALNEVTPLKMRAFEWITEGMPRLH